MAERDMQTERNKKADRKGFSPDEIASFCSQIAMLLGGGIPLYEGIYMLYEELEEGRTRELLHEVDDKVRTGMPFYQALEESGAFPEYMVHMVQLGEMTGKLENIMRSLAAYYERECAVKASIRSVILYPVMLFSMMAVILMVLVFRILPMFEDVFAELDGKSLTAESMMRTSMITGRVIAGIVAVILVLIVILAVWYRTRGGSRALTSMLNSMPFTRKLTDKIAVGRFLAALAVMVAGGMETTEAVERAGRVTGNARVAARVAKCRQLLTEGSKLDEALGETELLTGLQARMLGVGLKSGAGDDVFYKLSEQYDEEISSRLNSLAGYVETTLVVVLSLLVGVILISVMMPLVSVISSI